MAYYKSIGLIGRAQSGKDSVGARLAKRYGYQRVAFADQLKRAALRIDPLIVNHIDVPERLSAIVGRVGWDTAKVMHPEIRRILQHVGQTVRELDADFWIRHADPAIEAADRLNLPVVVTDVRYPNEVAALEARGFHMVRVTRPGTDTPGSHTSETALDDWRTPLTISNSGTLADLHNIVDSLLLPRASRR
ncbi:deoxynucleotide monophosphate kinase family protein [Streptomyces diastaticus]